MGARQLRRIGAQSTVTTRNGGQETLAGLEFMSNCECTRTRLAVKLRFYSRRFRNRSILTARTFSAGLSNGGADTPLITTLSGVK